MATPTEIFKSTVKTTIEDKTAEGSVSNADIASRFYDAADLIATSAASSSVALVGPANSTTNPGSSTTPRYYTFSTAGTYTNFKDSTNASIVVAANEAGYLVYNGSYWTKQTIPVDLSGKADTSALTSLDNSVYKKTDIDARIALSNLDNYPFYISDLQNKSCLAINAAGSIAIIKFIDNLFSAAALKDGTLNKSKFDIQTNNQFGLDLDERSGFLYAITNNSNQILFGITNKGRIYGNIDLSGLPPASISADKLSSDVTKYLTFGNVNDKDFSDTDDDGYHTYETDVIVQLTKGTLFERFPFIKSKLLNGVNSTGVSLDFRRRIPVSIKGKSYRGTFGIDPTINGTTYIDYVSPTRALPSTTGRVEGDYYRVNSTNAAAFTVTGSLTVYRGDLIVYNGSAFVVKPGPFRTLTALPDDFVVVTTAGTWEGTSYDIGDKMHVTGVQSLNSEDFYFLTKPKQGDLFYRGEFDPATLTPANIGDGDLYQASAAGTFNGLTFAVGDYLIRRSGVWGYIKNNTVTTVPNGSYFHFDVRNAADIEVRRTDKAATLTNVVASVRVNQEQVPYREELRVWGDSMSSPFGSHFATYSPRTMKVTPMGGATSYEVLSMVKREVLINQDDDGKVFVFVHGTNNGFDYQQTINAALEMTNLVGSRTRRYIHVSPFGSRDAVWNGTRLVATNQEQAKAGTNYVALTEKWYQKTMPKHFFNFRLQMATKVDATVDPQNPGMTEAQVYETYGTLPLSWFFDYPAAGFLPNQLNYVGTWTSTTLPTGGNNLDYYIRTANATIGNLIVNRAGIWVEYSYDRVHLNDKGRGFYMQLFVQFLTDNKF